MIRKFTSSLVLAATLVAASSPALALTSDPLTKAVMICGQDQMTARSYERTYGERPVFMTARQVLEADKGWEAPRCMSEREYAELVRVNEARVRAAR
ncbi:hypothetical protein [Brevundimonas fluminis]|jgi:hypothetical protein|uniref:hypothetical protein n=1 Tax=Brevundimonas fluminis TaxID=2487274 RepID=UPI000F656D1F|nr:hypothetical protein [Brevundimonas fluminis]